MRNSALTFWLALVVAGSVAYGSWVALHRFNETGQPTTGNASSADLGNLPPGKPLPPLKLTDQNGNEFDSASLKGRVWVASYFFASCPGPCFKLNQALASLQAEPELKDVRFVSITCDPRNDSPEVLAKYAERFNANPKRWTFLTGDLPTIVHYAQGQFLLEMGEKTHSERAVVLDRNSTVRGYFNLTDPDEVSRLRRRLLQVLAEPANKPADPLDEKAATAKN